MGIYSEIIVAAAAALLGVLGTIATAKYRESISTKKEQLKNFYAPLEILVRMNARSYRRYRNKNLTAHDREYIEKNIWHPNHVATRELIMKQSHHLARMPDEILDLLEHINVWLSEYERVHVKKEKNGPVFAGPRGYPYPDESDRFICETASALRKALNKR